MANLTPLAALRMAALPYTGSAAQQDKLFARVAGAPFVLIGEASHGTHEFYRERAALTKRLIAEAGYHAVVVEADWPDAYRVHRYIVGAGSDRGALEALAGFRRFPTWMWRNADVLDFVGWLRAHNQTLTAELPKVGFFGLDLYSLYTSIREVLLHLERIDPAAAAEARKRYSCFDHFNEDAQTYGYAAATGFTRPCEQDAVRELLDAEARALTWARKNSDGSADDVFYVEQNARLVRNAEEYYRRMFGARVSTWNLRDQHMCETLEAVVRHLSRAVERPKVVVWAHNSHLGDARATDMQQIGELNVGQLLRERHGRDVAIVGFTTYEGTVTAARDWDEPAELRSVLPALPGSWEDTFHELELQRFVLLCEDASLQGVLRQARLERAIGVVYRPETERASHYLRARIGEQFDAVIHIDRTRAVEPLELRAEWQPEPPETYPFAI